MTKPIFAIINWLFVYKVAPCHCEEEWNDYVAISCLDYYAKQKCYVYKIANKINMVDIMSVIDREKQIKIWIQKKQN